MTVTPEEIARLKRSSQFVDQCEAVARASDFDVGVVGSGLVQLGLSIMYSLPVPCDGLTGLMLRMLADFEKSIAVPDWEKR